MFFPLRLPLQLIWSWTSFDMNLVDSLYFFLIWSESFLKFLYAKNHNTFSKFKFWNHQMSLFNRTWDERVINGIWARRKAIFYVDKDQRDLLMLSADIYSGVLCIGHCAEWHASHQDEDGARAHTKKSKGKEDFFWDFFQRRN